MQTGTVLAHNIEKLANTSYQSLLQGITDIVNPAKNQTVTATLQAQKIRSFANSIARIIMKSSDLSSEEKISAFDGTQQNFARIRDASELSQSTQNAFIYIIRLFQSKQDSLTKTFSFLRNTLL